MIYWCAYYALKPLNVFTNKDEPCPSHKTIFAAMVKVSGMHNSTLSDMMDKMQFPYSRQVLARYREAKHATPKMHKPTKRKQAKIPKPFVCTSEFLQSDQWRALRYRALELHGPICQCCGQSRKQHGVVLHVDHIKPRSKFPELALDINNLQILCADCNLGKSNKFETDWR